MVAGTAISELVTELWAGVRSLADEREVDLDLRLLGRPTELDERAHDILSLTVGAVVDSARSARELHHAALELSYTADGISVRVEHDGNIDSEARQTAERRIFSSYGDLGELGGTLSLSSGRGFGLRLELNIPFGVIPIPTRSPDSAPPRARLAPSRQEVEAVSERLTPQEETTLSLLASGLSNKEIADRMNLGVGTVKFHLAQIYQKLGVQGRGRGAAVARARELGLIFD
ncbi:MAG: LuxR C-terminal-related transcriptional regulator [Chloroflexia bacterium]